MWDLTTWEERARQDVQGKARFTFVDDETLVVGEGQSLTLIPLGPSGFGERREFVPDVERNDPSGGLDSSWRRSPSAHSYAIKTVSYWNGRVFSTSNAEGDTNGLLRVWDAATRALVWEVTLPGPPGSASIDARGLLVGFDGGAIRCYAVE